MLDRSQTEDGLLSAIIEGALFMGWKVHHDRRSDRALQQGTTGFVDLVMARDGIVIFAECKTERGGITPEQLAWKMHLPAESYHCRYRLWRPADLDAALKELAKP